MTSIGLLKIATRQRTYLARDITFAILVTVLMIIQISAFTM
jgi:hypothetical protein